MSQANPLRHGGFPLLKKWKLFMAFLVNEYYRQVGAVACLLSEI